jgi:hypothetical protein
MDRILAWKFAGLISVVLLWKLWAPCAAWLASFGMDGGVAWVSAFILFIIGPLMLMGFVRRYV